MHKYDDAIAVIDQFKYQNTTTTIATYDALDYVIAEDCYSQINVPSFRKSAMDGYAILQSSDLSKPFKVCQTIYAGDSANPNIKQQECVKIMTGAPIPDGLDQVIVKELATEIDNYVTFSIPNTKLNENICAIGEDIPKDQLLFAKGQVITPTVIASLISCGIFEIKVYHKPKILIVTTGDEVISENQALEYGQIYNSNLAFIKSSVKRLGFDADFVHIGDEMTQFHALINQPYDLIITTGAISVGDKDIIRHYITQKKAAVHFDRVNIMPGGPVVFWEHQKRPIISLAGSPFANFVTFELFARRIIAHLAKQDCLIATEKNAILASEYKKSIKKTRFLKAHFDGKYVTLPSNNHKASALYEMTKCNCLIRLERGEIELNINDQVKIIDLRRTYE